MAGKQLSTKSSNSGLADLINQPAELEELKVFIMSWNMGNAEPEGLMNVFDEKNARDSYDIFVIGLQESTYNYKGMVRSNTPGTHESINHFQSYIRSQFPDAQYEVVAHCYRAQLQLYVIAKKKYRGRISNVETCIENTGFLHVFPNKGGLLVSFHLDGTRLAFVSCHLTAHEGIEHCEQRNASIIEILGGVRAGDVNIDITEQFHHVFWMGDMNYRLTFDPRTPANSKKNIDIHNNQHRQVSNRPQQAEDITVELSDGAKPRPGFDAEKVGADGALDDDDSSEGEDDEDEGASPSNEKKKEWEANRKKVLDLIVREQWKELMQFDELNREIDSKRVLNGFIALQPSFPPTFKRTRGESIKQVSGPTSPSTRWELRRSSVSDYDNVSVKTYYHHKRIPSYTDRILFKSLSTFSDHCRALFFESCEAAVSSDHKPVRAGFQIKLTKGSQDILVDRQLLGKSKKPAESRNKDPKILKLQVFDIRGIELEEMDSQMFGGGSDPYIVITTDPPNLLLHKNRICRNVPGVKSEVIKHNLNPVWEKPLFLTLASTDLEGLGRNASLIFQVWDEDLSNPDDLIGCVTIPLRDVLMSVFVDRRPFVFEKFIRTNSELMGQLSGRILLDGDAIKTEDDARLIAKERENPTNPNLIPLSQALLEASSADSTNCCTIN